MPLRSTPWRSRATQSNKRRRQKRSAVERLETRELLSARALLASAALAPTPATAAATPLATPAATPLASSNSSIQSSWSSQVIAPLSVTQDTGQKPQSKIWEHAGQWFSVMPNSSGTWVWRLDGSSWSPVLNISGDTKVEADVKEVGDVTHVLLFHGNSTQLASLEYVAGAPGTYRLWSARGANVNLFLPGSTETASIDVDSQGRMWVAYDNKSSGTIEVRYSDGNYSSWSTGIVLASGVNSDDISAITAMPNGRIGVMWSNQNTRRFGFRTHLDGSGATSWTADEVPASSSAQNVGGGMADDHIHFAVASDGTLYAAVKTSYDKSGYPKLALLIRHPNGQWDPLYWVDSTGTRPIVLLNEAQHRLLYVYTASDSGGNILYRETSTDSISLSATKTLISGSLNNVTSMKDNFTDQLLVMAGTGSKAQAVLLQGPAIPATQTNQAPTVNAGLDVSTQNQSVTLNGTVSDDGLPQPASLALQWTMVSGSGAVNFANPSSASTSATFSTVGSYVLRLTASDGQLAASDDIAVTITAPPPSPAPTPSPTASGAAGIWKFNDDAGTTAVDSSGNNNQGTLQGGAQLGNGHAGSGGLVLSGANQRVVVPDSPSLDITQSITLSAWIAPQVKDTQYVVKKAHIDSVDGYEISLSSSGKVFVRFNQKSSGDTFRLDSASSYPTNGSTWMHVVATYDGAMIRLYINGQLQASKAAKFSIKTNNVALGIGAEDTGFRSMRGVIDDVLVANRALSADEVAALYQGTFPGDASGPVASALAAPSAAPLATEAPAPAGVDATMSQLGAASHDTSTPATVLAPRAITTVAKPQPTRMMFLASRAAGMSAEHKP